MKQLKSRKEIEPVIDGLPEDKNQKLMYLVSNVFHDGDGESFRIIDNDYVYPLRWELFEHSTDSELIYHKDNVNQFIDVCIDIFFNKKPT